MQSKTSPIVWLNRCINGSLLGLLGRLVPMNSNVTCCCAKQVNVPVIWPNCSPKPSMIPIGISNSNARWKRPPYRHDAPFVIRLLDSSRPRRAIELVQLCFEVTRMIIISTTAPNPIDHRPRPWSMITNASHSMLRSSLERSRVATKAIRSLVVLVEVLIMIQHWRMKNPSNLWNTIEDRHFKLFGYVLKPRTPSGNDARTLLSSTDISPSPLSSFARLFEFLVRWNLESARNFSLSFLVYLFDWICSLVFVYSRLAKRITNNSRIEFLDISLTHRKKEKSNKIQLEFLSIQRPLDPRPDELMSKDEFFDSIENEYER